VLPELATREIPIFGGINVTMANAFSAAALLVSMFALGRPWWKERRANAKASLSARIEECRVIKGNRAGKETRYVVTNHGPAKARDISIAAYRNGELIDLRLPGRNNETSKPLLHPGEEHHMYPLLAMGDELPELFVITWRDRRIARQKQEFYPSVRHV